MAYADQVLARAGLVAFLPLSGDFADAGPNEYDAVGVGGITFETGSPFPGVPNYAELDGTSGYIDTSAPLDPTQPFSVVGVVRIDPNPTYDVAVLYQQQDGTGPGRVLLNHRDASVSDTGFNTYMGGDQSTYLAGEYFGWAHLAITSVPSGSKAFMTLYLDGVAVGSITTTGDIEPNDGSLLFGVNKGLDRNFLKGAYASIAAYDRALSAQEIADDYEAATGAASSPINLGATGAAEAGADATLALERLVAAAADGSTQAQAALAVARAISAEAAGESGADALLSAARQLGANAAVETGAEAAAYLSRRLSGLTAADSGATAALISDAQLYLSAEAQAMSGVPEGSAALRAAREVSAETSAVTTAGASLHLARLLNALATGETSAEVTLAGGFLDLPAPAMSAAFYGRPRSVRFTGRPRTILVAR